LAFYAFEEGKALIVAINKADLLDSSIKEAWRYHKSEYEFFYKKIEMIELSCKSGERVGKIMPLIDKVWQRYQMQFNDQDLAHVLKGALLHSPLYRQEQRLQLASVQQIKQGPPVIKLEVNLPKLVGVREMAFFEGILRKEYQLKSVPIIFKIVADE